MATEMRLIDANAYAESWKKVPDMDEPFTARDVIEDVMSFPIVDAVEVVRCKECKHYHQYHVGKTNDLCEWGKCKLINMDVDMPENGFCSYGERRSDATE